MSFALILDPAKNGPAGVLTYAVGQKQTWGKLTGPDEPLGPPILFRTFDDACNAARDIALMPLDGEVPLAVVGVQNFLDAPPDKWEDLTCVEASVFSTLTYIACGQPAVAFVFHSRDNRAYAMCKACAFHNRDNRRGRIIGQKEGMGL